MHPLVLPIHLRVAGSPEAVFDTEVRASSVPKSTGKLGAMISGDIVRYASFADHLFEDYFC